MQTPLLPEDAMTEIELTDKQRRVLAAGRGKPLEVVDPDTQQRYVLVAREQFERVRSLLEGPPAQAPGPRTTPAGPAPERQPLRQRVRELPLPPAVAAEAKRYGKRLGFWRAKHFRELEEQMKLQHYYGGKWIAYLQTDEGPVVVAAADSLDDPSFDQQLSFLTAEERRSVLIDSPSRLFDEESLI